MQEDALFFHEVLKLILDDNDLYDQLFEDLDGETNVQIEIQKQASQIDEFDKIFAVSLSGTSMSNFWQQTHNTEYDPICDLTITINGIVIIIEAKRDNIDCTSQLYNQILNIFNHQNKRIDDFNQAITPFDLNWPKLMSVAVKVASFEKTTGNINRFLTDFITLVKDHNFRWLPETPIGSLKNVSHTAIKRRVESAINQFCTGDDFVEKLTYNDRLGTTFSKDWSNELLFKVEQATGNLIVEIYPGNTKRQGLSIFNKEPKFCEELIIGGERYATKKVYHIKFMGQSSITGLWLNEDDFIKPLHTKHNFKEYAGRVKRADWPTIESLLDQHIKVDWKKDCNWQEKIVNSNRTQFDLSFGYRVSIIIPYQKLAQLDLNHNEITPLANLVESIYKAFETSLIVEKEAAA